MYKNVTSRRIVAQLEGDGTTRRQLLRGASALLSYSLLVSAFARAGDTSRYDPAAGQLPKNHNVEYGHDTLPSGIRSRYVDNNNGVHMHILEAGFEVRGGPAVLLLHGFPELAYTWRKQLLPLAQLGFHVIAPDLRGYGRSVVTPVGYDDDLLPYSMMNRVSDVVGLIRALGHVTVAAVVGHDWGGPTAAWCARLRPDVFRSVVSMSTPFFGAGSLPLNSANEPKHSLPAEDAKIYDLSALTPPRKHYQNYFTTREANDDLWHAPQGVHALLRAQYYFKGADWSGNRPFRLKSWAAAELAKIPKYYIMDLDKSYAQTMAEEMPTKEQIDACSWMTENELRVFSIEYLRTGFQGGLNSYRIDAAAGDLNAFSDRTIDVPALYIAGASEWGAYQAPGALEEMKNVCSRLLGTHFVQGAGHSIPEEQPSTVNKLLIDFLRKTRA